MDKKLYWDILDKERMGLLPLFKDFKEDFYLAGDTALALQLGHRDSIDFDFFSTKSFSTEELFKKVEKTFAGHEILKTGEAKDTLTFIVNSRIKISFFAYSYELIESLLDEDNFKLASIEDIGAMKLSAITSRSVLKDYVDLYFIFQHIKLEALLGVTKEKFPTIEINPILKSLVYFDDIEEEPILFKHDDNISFESIKDFLTQTVKRYLEETNN